MTLLHIAVQRGKLTNKFNNFTTTCQWRISYTSINISLLTFTTLYEKHAKHFDLACLSVHKSLSVLINLYLCCRFTLPSLQGDFHVYNNLEFSIKGDQDVAVWNYLSMIFFFAFFKTSTFTCVLQHILNIFVTTFWPWKGDILIRITSLFRHYDFFSWQFQFSEIINEFEGIYFQILFKSF